MDFSTEKMTPKEIIQKLAAQTEDKVFLAKLIATHFHEGQMRKGEKTDYIVHPERIVAKLEDPDDKCIAWLHDVVEDTDVTLDDLRTIFSEPIIQGIHFLTKVEGDRDATKEKIRQAPQHVQRIKLLDVLDNMQTLDGVSDAAKQRKINDSKNFYIPLAREIGEDELADDLASLRERLI